MSSTSMSAFDPSDPASLFFSRFVSLSHRSCQHVPLSNPSSSSDSCILTTIPSESGGMDGVEYPTHMADRDTWLDG